MSVSIATKGIIVPVKVASGGGVIYRDKALTYVWDIVKLEFCNSRF